MQERCSKSRYPDTRRMFLCAWSCRASTPGSDNPSWLPNRRKSSNGFVHNRSMRRAIFVIPVLLAEAWAPDSVTFRETASHAGITDVIVSGGLPKNYVLQV